MSNMMESLAKCEQITEWVSLFDQRMATATGEPSPNRGTSLRESWGGNLPATRLETEISRLIVPASVELSGPMTAEFNTDEWKGEVRRRVFLNFTSEADWLKCFPLGEQSRLPNSDEDWHAWAGMAVCGDVLGLAVFAEELLEFQDTHEVLPVQARVQPVPSHMFERIINS